MRWLVSVPLFVVLLIGSLSNSTLGSWRFWPWEGALELPLYLPVLLALVCGYGAASLIALWRFQKRIRHLERQIKAQGAEPAKPLDSDDHDA